LATRGHIYPTLLGTLGHSLKEFIVKETKEKQKMFKTSFSGFIMHIIGLSLERDCGDRRKVIKELKNFRITLQEVPQLKISWRRIKEDF